MVTYELIETVDNGYLYRYYPEGQKDHPGIIFVEANKESWKIIELSDEDPFRTYAGHVFYGVTRGEPKGIRAWY